MRCHGVVALPHWIWDGSANSSVSARIDSDIFRHISEASTVFTLKTYWCWLERLDSFPKFLPSEVFMSAVRTSLCPAIRLVAGSLEISSEKLARGLSWLATSVKVIPYNGSYNDMAERLYRLIYLELSKVVLFLGLAWVCLICAFEYRTSLSTFLACSSVCFVDLALRVMRSFVQSDQKLRPSGGAEQGVGQIVQPGGSTPGVLLVVLALLQGFANTKQQGSKEMQRATKYVLCASEFS